MPTIRLTMSQALVLYLRAQKIQHQGERQPLIAGVWAIFGHGNVAGMGEALYQVRDDYPTLRAHSEQGMAHAAIAFAKARNRKQCMACTTSIGPGATNMVTAAALAHVNRLPVLLLPGDTFATRAADPVLQQLEHFDNPTVTANDCFKPVSRYWDRISRPEQLLTSLPRAMRVLTDPVACGPVTLALPQDVQTMAYDYPAVFFVERVHSMRRPGADVCEMENAVALLRQAQQPLLVAGGGVHYSGACDRLAHFAKTFAIPVAETQAGKSALPWDHPNQMGAIGVTGSAIANELAAQADLILAVGTRLQDFTTASRTLFNPQARLLGLNVNVFDAAKHGGVALVTDARRGLEELEKQLSGWRTPTPWVEQAAGGAKKWHALVDKAVHATDTLLPTDAQVIGVVNRLADAASTVVAAAGGLPGELHKLWRAARPGGYHVEYGYSCMGYELAGGLGVKMASPDNEVYVMVGDGSYLMLNSEIASSVMLEQKLIIVILNNRGYGCINRLQQSCGGASFNNLLHHGPGDDVDAPTIDFAAHAAALGAQSEQVADLAELAVALERAKKSTRTYAIVIDTDPSSATTEGGAWWDVAVAEVSASEPVRQAFQAYHQAKQKQQR